MNHPTEFQKYFSDLLNNIGKETNLKSIQGFSEELEGFKQRINDDFFRLVVIGEFSSGKSTFINALIGRDILSHATKETTAVLTRIVNVDENDSRKGSAVVFMKTGQKLSVSNLEELKEYTTAVSKKYQVAQEIEVVEIYMPLMHTARPLMIMDTPGLNGIAEGHFEQTKEIVKKAHACIYLIQQRGLTKDDLEFLKANLIPYQQRFIFVQNFIDEFNSTEDETLNDRIISLRKTLTEKVFVDAPNHEFFICGVSALKELASRDKLIKRLYATDTEDLTEDDRQRFATESNFASFRKILEENFNSQHLDEIQYRDTAVAILHWVKGLQEKISRRLDEDSEIYKTSREKNVAERIERLIQKIRDRRQDNLMAIRGFISGEIRKLNKELEKIIADDTAALENELARGINECTSLEDVERKRTRLTNEISRGLERLGSKTIDYCKISFQGLYQLVMERVEEYSGIRSVNVSENFRVDLPTEQRQFQSENYIERYKRELRQKQAAVSNEYSVSRNANSNVQTAEADVRNSDYDVADVQQRINQKQSEINRMGSRPAERVWYETVAVKRGGFFGSIMDIFSTKTEQQERRDDSAGERWDSQRRQLQQQQNSLSQQLDETKKKRDAAERVLDRYRRDARDSADKIRKLESEIQRLEESIKLETAKFDKERRVARENFIRTCKNQLREEVAKYFHSDYNGGATRRLLDELKKQTAEGEMKISSDAEKRFNRSIEQKLNELEQVKQGNISPLQEKISGFEQASRNLGRYVERMEEILA